LNIVDLSEKKVESTKKSLRDSNLKVQTLNVRPQSDLNVNYEKHLFEMRIQSEESPNIVNTDVDVTPGFRI